MTLFIFNGFQNNLNITEVTNLVGLIFFSALSELPLVKAELLKNIKIIVNYKFALLLFIGPSYYILRWLFKKSQRKMDKKSNQISLTM